MAPDTFCGLAPHVRYAGGPFALVGHRVVFLMREERPSESSPLPTAGGFVGAWLRYTILHHMPPWEA